MCLVSFSIFSRHCSRLAPPVYGFRVRTSTYQKQEKESRSGQLENKSGSNGHQDKESKSDSKSKDSDESNEGRIGHEESNSGSKGSEVECEMDVCIALLKEGETEDQLLQFWG